jgi:hypothetical protein
MSADCGSGVIVREQPESASYGHSRFNATRHGLSGRSVLLPWEDADELEALLAELMEEHQPRGPTERHLVAQIAAVMWGQGRVLQAEVAEIRDELRELLGDWLGGEDRRCGSRPHRPEGQGRRRKRHPEDRGPDAGRAASARTSPAIARRS